MYIIVITYGSKANKMLFVGAIMISEVIPSYTLGDFGLESSKLWYSSDPRIFVNKASYFFVKEIYRYKTVNIRNRKDLCLEDDNSKVELRSKTNLLEPH